MCGRFAQFSSIREFLDELHQNPEKEKPSWHKPVNRYNVAPGTKVNLIRHSHERGLVVDSVHWGWGPYWATHIENPINAGVESVATSTFFRSIWPNRCLIPVNGWYEWMEEYGYLQPYYIHLKTRKPIFLAGIGRFSGPEEHQGFIIITANPGSGICDITARRPVILPPGHAWEWLHPETSGLRAEELIGHRSYKPGDFTGYAVQRSVKNIQKQGPGLLTPPNL